MNEVEVYYLKRKSYESRKHQQYEEEFDAMEVFDKTVKKFQKQRTEALIVFRIFERGLWRIFKSERT